MDTRALKTGHWIAAANRYHSFSTGDLFENLEAVVNGEFEPPLAVHVSPNPIKAMHAYLWAPVIESTDSLTVNYGDQTVRFEWNDFTGLVDDIETLRSNGFRVKDVRSGEPRVKDVDSVGLERYRRIENRLSKHRGSSLFELALTASTSS
jgi:hypothetical protein